MVSDSAEIPISWAAPAWLLGPHPFLLAWGAAAMPYSLLVLAQVPPVPEASVWLALVNMGGLGCAVLILWVLFRERDKRASEDLAKALETFRLEMQAERAMCGSQMAGMREEWNRERADRLAALSQVRDERIRCHGEIMGRLGELDEAIEEIKGRRRGGGGA